MSFEGKVVIVTGAGSGIGAAIALKFAEQKAKVVLVARTEVKLMEVSNKCQEYSVKPVVIVADVTNESDVRNVINTTISMCGKIDILINSAGIVKNVTISGDTAMQVFDQTMAINLRSVVFLTKLAAPFLIKTKGNIVNISGLGAVDVLHQGCFAYCVSKAGLDHFTRCMALELGAAGVRVNTVNPGPVESDIFKYLPAKVDRNEVWTKIATFTVLGRVSKPEEIGDLVLFISSDKAKAITGSSFFSDNGLLLKRDITIT